jgi:hypothetical protein
MRFLAKVLLFAILPLAGCTSPQDTSSPSKMAPQEASPQPLADRAGSRGALDALDVDTLKKKDGERVTVKGKVYSTHLAQSGKVFTLNLGPNWKTCLKATIFKDDFEKWKGGTDDIKGAYEGKVVVIEGKVKLYQGSPEIVLNTPSQIGLVTEGAK